MGLKKTNDSKVTKMANNQILLAQQVSPKKLSKGSENDRMVKLFYPLLTSESQFTQLVIQTPSLYVPFNRNDRKWEGKIIGSSLSASTRLIGSDSNKQQINIFCEKMKEINSHVGTLLSHLDRKVYPTLTESKNGNYAPTFRMEIDYKDDQPDISIFNEKGTELPFDVVERGITASFIVALKGLWVSKTKTMGFKWVIKQILLEQQTQEKDSFKPFAFRSD